MKNRIASLILERGVSFAALLAAAAFWVLSLASCMTTTTTAPDGTVTKTKAADPAALAIGGKALDTYVAVKVTQQKSLAGAEAPASTPLPEGELEFNPLDFPGGPFDWNWHPEGMGRFGPFGAMWGRTY